MIRAATAEDAQQLTSIYNHYILNTVVTFEEKIISTVEMVARIQTVQSVGLPWLVADDNGTIEGYAYAATWKNRHAYRFSVEITIYLAPDATNKGVGSALYEALFSCLEGSGCHAPVAPEVHAVVACIALPNAHSVALHEKFGMKKVAHFNEVGCKFDRWLDVGYWQANLPR